MIIIIAVLIIDIIIVVPMALIGRLDAGLACAIAFSAYTASVYFTTIGDGAEHDDGI